MTSVAPRRSLVRAARICAVIGLAYLGGIALFGMTARPRAAELAVVFGNTVMADGQPSGRLRARLDAAVLVFRAGTVHRILVSGGVEQPGDLDEAAVMAAYLRAHGIPDGAVLQDPAGTNTRATARHAAALANPGGVVLVTQWFHLPRALLALHQCGVRNVSGAWPRWFERRDAYALLREAVALPVYAISLAPCSASAAGPNRKQERSDEARERNETSDTNSRSHP